METILTIITSVAISVIIIRLLERPKAKTLQFHESFTKEPAKYKPLEEFKSKPPPKTPKTADDNALKAERLRSKENGRDKDPL